MKKEEGKEERKEQFKLEYQKINVMLEGISDIMFDRFIDHSKEDRPPEQKLYLTENNITVLPSENICSFLFGNDPAGCAKEFEGRKCKTYIRTGLSHVFFDKTFIPFLDESEKEIIFTDFGADSKFGRYLGSGRTKSAGGSSIKQPAKYRPILRMPWFLRFDILLIANNLIDSTKLYNYFSNGGILIALGTYRPRFGRFIVKDWKD